MIHVDCIPKPSPIHGVGLFALKAISSGTLIWTLEAKDRKIVQPSEFNKMDPVTQYLTRFYGWLPTGKGYWIVPTDISRFINHSVKANTTTEATRFYAAKDIRAGEEITQDYSKFEYLRSEVLPDDEAIVP